MTSIMTVEEAIDAYEQAFPDGLPRRYFNPFDEDGIIRDVQRALATGKAISDEVEQAPNPREPSL